MEKTINIAEEIAEKIKIRYAQIDHTTHTTANMVIDAFYPTYVYKQLKGINPYNNLSTRVSAINPFIARELGIYNIQIDDLCRMLGYKKQDIKNLLNQVKEKNENIILVGLGGTGSNFLYFTNQLCHYVNTFNIFNKLEGWDNDDVDLTNVFRLPLYFDVTSVGKNTLSASIAKSDICDKQNFKIAKKQTFLYANITNPKNIELNYAISNLTPPIFYGAPDIQSRILLKDYRFISATHGNDDCQLYCKPQQDAELQVESYGMINLSVFFMNQLRMTIAFLELIAAGETFTEEKNLFEYSFSKEYLAGNISSTGCNRTYNFPILLETTVNETEPTNEEDQSIPETFRQEYQINTELIDTMMQDIRNPEALTTQYMTPSGHLVSEDQTEPIQF